MKRLALLPLAFAALRRRLLVLLAFGAVMLAAAFAARALTGSGEHAEMDRFFELGGATLASAFIVFGWLIGRIPLIATLVLLSGVFSQDRAIGLTRLYGARPVSPVSVYGTRVAGLALAAFLLSALLLPLFDLILLGHWGGLATLVLAAAYVLTYSALTALLSLFTRADAWLALLLGILATTWHALRTAGRLDGVPPGGREFVTLILPPHGSLLALENAFGNVQPIPWSAFGYVCVYAAVLLIAGGILVGARDL